MKHFFLKRTIIVASLFAASTAWAGDTATPSMLANTCVGCHGPDGSSVGPASPSIAGMSYNYLMGAMLAYKYDDNEDKLNEAIDNDKDLEDVEALMRKSTIMARIAKGYTEDEIKILSKYFSEKEMQRPEQNVDAALVKTGAKRHKKYCEKCHEDDGRLAEDDTGVLAGQWMPYFNYTMTDYISGDRDMTKKMKKKVKAMQKKHGDKAIEQLSHFYASQK